MVRVVFLNIILWLIAGLALGQDPFVELEVNPKTIEKGQSISVTIKTNVDGRLNMNLPDEFIQSGAMQTGMSSSIVFIDGKQKNVRYNYQSFTGYFESDGNYIIGPISIQTKNGKVESESHVVKVIKRQNMISADPSQNMNQLIFGIIEQSKEELYEGEPLLLEGKVYSQVEVLQVEGFNSFYFDGPSDKHPLTNPNHVNSSYAVINGKNIQTFKIGKSLIFPEKIGEYNIEPFQTVILYNNPRTQYPARAKIVSNETKVKIKPLPAGTPRHFIGAVGKFDVSAEISNTKIDQGKVIELKVKVSGHGNLHNIEKPKIYLPSGLAFYGDPETSDSIHYSARGSEGSKSFTFFIQVNRPGNIQINPIKIAFFNPETEKYETAECKVKMLKVNATGEEILEIPEVKKQEVRAPTMQPYITERIGVDHSSNDLFSGWKGTALLFSPIMLGLVLGFGVRIKKQTSEASSAKRMLSQHRGDAIAAIVKLREKNANIDKLEELTKVLVGFLAAEFKVSKGEVSRALLKSKVPEELSEENYEKLIEIFNELDSMKYGGRIENAEISHLKDEVELIIKTFEE